MRIHFINHSSFVIHTKKLTIFIDPYKLNTNQIQKANLILITHDHFDHFNTNDLEKISTNKTKIIYPEYINEIKFFSIKGQKIKMSTHQTIQILDLNISTIPAYNMKSHFHPKNQGVGYIFEIEDNNKTYHIYHAGDTDYTKEMSTLKGIDFALIPVGGTYTMDEKQAIEFIKETKPKNIIPMHYKNSIGLNLNSDIENLKKTTKELELNLIELQPNETKDFF